MKELNRTDRLTIASVLVSLVLIIGFFTLRETSTPFEVSREEGLAILSGQSGQLAPEEIENLSREGKIFRADLRSPKEFFQEHPEGAANIPLQDLLASDNLDLLREQSANGSMILLSSNDPLQVNTAWLLLRQLGMEKVYFTLENKPGQPGYDYKTIAAEVSGAGSGTTPAQSTPVSLPVIKREKKAKAEGGC